MLDAHVVDAILSSHRRSYVLLRWMDAQSISNDNPAFSTPALLQALSSSTAAEAWLETQSSAVEELVGPMTAHELSRVAGILGTYLQSSYEWLCPYCQGIKPPRHLVTKRPDADALLRAWELRLQTVTRLADAHSVVLTRAQLVKLVDLPSIQEPLAALAYVHDLIDRANGFGSGTAGLVLWRGFAWQAGRPRDNFMPSTQLFLDAERAVVSTLLAADVSG